MGDYNRGSSPPRHHDSRDRGRSPARGGGGGGGKCTGTAKRFRYFHKQPPRSAVASASDLLATTPDVTASSDISMNTAIDLPGLHYLDPVLNLDDFDLDHGRAY